MWDGRGGTERVEKGNMVTGMEFFIVYLSGNAHKMRVGFPLCSCAHYFHCFDAQCGSIWAGCCSYNFKPKCARLCVFMPFCIINCTENALWSHRLNSRECELQTLSFLLVYLWAKKIILEIYFFKKLYCEIGLATKWSPCGDIFYHLIENWCHLSLPLDI